MRCFVAIQLGEAEREALALAAREICGAHSGFRMIPARNLHLTLQFLGELGSGTLEAVREALPAGLRGIGPIEVELCGSGAFPSSRRPRVVWVGIRGGADELTALAARVAGCLAPLGLAPDKPFTPHITVARARGGGRRTLACALAGDRILARTRAEAVDLMQSQLSREGACYRSLLRVELAA
jgi:RNA 2',3'-cyclic 3'-phosphodiesterase